MWDDRYILCRTLGEGGMGRVLHARDTQEDEKEVAIKILLPELRCSTAAFEREYEIMRSLDHPNIPKVFNFGFARNDRGGQTPYFIMEYCSGVDLKRIVPENKKDIKFLLRWMSLICHALHHVHERGFLHRDIKPENIIVDDVGDMVSLIDFGVSSRIGDPPEDIFIGTPEYSAPEVLGGYMFDERADLYAIGLILYEIVQGRRPWSGSDESDLWEKRIQGRPPPIENGCPESLKALIGGLLKPRMRDRPRSATVVAEVLEEIANPEKREAKRKRRKTKKKG